MIVVADSGPLHYLILLEEIELLRASTARPWYSQVSTLSLRTAGGFINQEPVHQALLGTRSQHAQRAGQRDGSACGESQEKAVTR